MVERRGRPRLPLEPLDGEGIPGKLFGKKLEGDLPPEARIFRPVNDSHPAASELLSDVVMRNFLAELFLKATSFSAS
jgi:hypothetical protein